MYNYYRFKINALLAGNRLERMDIKWHDDGHILKDYDFYLDDGQINHYVWDYSFVLD